MYNYIDAWGKIPIEELHASSVQHPDHESMRWLLHTRRVPKTEESEGADAALPRCAGVGTKDARVWACWTCLSSLCRRSGPVMPDLALANWMWLGRLHPLYRELPLAMRLLLGRGRPMMRTVYLGRGPRDEVHQGLQGNTMIIAQPNAKYEQVMPNVPHALDSLVLMFCKTVDDVSRAHTLVVQRGRYAECMRHRIAVCPTFADVRLDDEAMLRDLPENAVPTAFIEHATCMPEASTMRTTMDGPASRHSQFGPNPKEEADDTSDEDTAPTSCGLLPGGRSGAQPPASSHGERRDNDEEPCNEFETVIGVDTHSDQPEVELFVTMQDKLQLLTQEAGKLARATGVGEEIPTSLIAGQEQCRRIVVDLQDVAAKLRKAHPARLEASITGSVHPGVEALAVPAGKPMSSFHAATLPAAYVEFVYGDCCPFLERPKKLACEDIFKALLCREELEYTLESDCKLTMHQAGPESTIRNSRRSSPTCSDA